MHVIHDENEAEALGVLIEMLEAHLARKDRDAVLRLAEDQIHFIGVGAAEMACGKSEFEALLREQIARDGQPYRLSYGRLYCDGCGRDCVLISGEIKTSREGGPSVPMRLSALLRRKCGRYLVCSLHVSAATDISR